MERPNITASKTTLHAQDDTFDREFYGRMTAEEKVARTFQLSVELWELNTGAPVEQRLLRHVARVIRGGR